MKEEALPPVYLAHLFFGLSSADRATLAQKISAQEGLSTPEPQSSETQNEVMSLLRGGKRTAYVRALMKLSGLPVERVEQAIDEPSCETMAVLCQGLGLGRAVFSSFVILTRPDIADNERKQTALLGLPDAYPPEGAAALIAAWTSKGGRAQQTPPGGRGSMGPLSEDASPAPPRASSLPPPMVSNKTAKARSAG